MNIGLIVAILAIVLIFQGTKTTGPNLSFVYQIPAIREQLSEEQLRSLRKYEVEVTENRKEAYDLFTEFYQENPELAEELGRIPDYADNKISDKDLEALVDIRDYYFESKNPKIKEAFSKMLDVGIKDKRAYCSPLEALKWVAGKHEFKEGSELYIDDPLDKYHLLWLLAFAWDFREEEKWGDFKRVTNRLNSPELVAKYLQDNIAWKFHKGKIPWLPTRFFRIKRGDCKDYANFATYCLRRAGYDARNVSIRTPRGGHVFCLYTENNKFFAIDNMNLRGPFYSSEKAIQAITSLH